VILLGSAGHPWGGAWIASDQEAVLPQGADLVRWRCTFCHGFDPPIPPPQNRDGWTETVDRMIRMGTPLTPEEREIIIRYLSTRFGKSSPPD